MTAPNIKKLGDKLILLGGKEKAIEVCKNLKWHRVLEYIELLNIKKDEKNG